MMPFSGFEPAFTVPNFHQKLSADRPVQVYTYCFDKIPESGKGLLANEPEICGTVHDFSRVPILPPHDHAHHEIAVVIQGAALHRMADRSMELRRGSVLAVAPGEVHAFERIDGLRMINCTYLTEWLFHDLRDLLHAEGLAPLFFPMALSRDVRRRLVPQWFLGEDALEPVLRELRDIACEREGPNPSTLLMRLTLQKLMILLRRNFPESDASLMPHQPLIRVMLERIEELIRQGEGFDPVALAREFRMSRDYCGRLFREATGWSPTDYYQHRRVQHACAMLLNSGQTATEVAHLLGYYDASHFSRLFKRYRGVSPREFRQRYGVAENTRA